MISGGSDLRGLARRSSVADVTVRLTGDASIRQASGIASMGTDFNAPGAAARSSPLCVVRQPRLPLAPLQRATLEDQRGVVRFLTVNDAISLMRAATDLHDLVSADLWFRQDELLRPLQESGYRELVERLQFLEADILKLQLRSSHPAMLDQHAFNSGSLVRPATITAGALPDVVVLGILFADYCCRSLMARSVTRVRQVNEQAVQRELQEKDAEKLQVEAALGVLEPKVEGVVFHYVSERLNNPRLGRPANADAAAQEPAGRDGTHLRLHNAIRSGNAELVRAGLRKFLSLPERFMPNTRKFARLIPRQAMSPLQAFGQHRCGSLSPLERRQYQCILVCVNEIVGAECFSPSDQMELRVKLVELCRGAIGYGNPATAAHILLGIQESTAGPAFKLSLLAAIGDPWHGELAGFVDLVSAQLGVHTGQAPEWVNGVIERLQHLKAVSPPHPEAGCSGLV